MIGRQSRGSSSAIFAPSQSSASSISRTVVLAATLYRSARRTGVMIRKTLERRIAAPCVRTGAPLMHADGDFDRLATCTPVRLWPD